MKSLIVFALFSCFAPDISMKASKRPAPHVVSNTQHATQDCKEDPLTPCVNEVVTIENPLFVPVIVELACGMDNDQQTVQVPARVRLTVDIELTNPPGRVPACEMVGWKLVK